MSNNDLTISGTESKPENHLSSHSETKTSTKILHSNKDLQTCNTPSNSKKQSSNDLSLINVPTKKMVELEDMLDKLDNNLDKVLAQMESVKKTRDELFLHTRKLQQNLELYGGEPDLDDERTKRLETMTSEIKKREDIMKELEKREILLSHSMLVIINSWAEELESNLKYYKKDSKKSLEISEIYKTLQDE